MRIIGQERGNLVGIDESGARVICSPLILSLEPPIRKEREAVVIPRKPVENGVVA